MDYIIDRFEGDFAVCQNVSDDGIKNVRLNLILGEVKEGDVITFENGKYFLNIQKTNERKKRIKEKFDALWD